MTWNPFGGSSNKDSSPSTVPKAPPPPPPPAAVPPPAAIPSSPPTDQTSLQQYQRPQLTEKQKYVKDMGYKTALAAAVICPIIIFMPPRKMDFYTFGLICSTAFCVNHVMQEHGHPGLLYAIAPKGSMEYQEKVAKSRKRYDGMMPSEAIWAQLKDVWNQRYDDDDDDDVEEEKKESMLDQIRREEAERGGESSSILKMLEEQEKKRK
ncbi:hypothetical protein TWF730_006759 [Orbilia blumenaviensis]|uniref:Uncharacterized protein n=1 Tax=Orbilia blumenaviensis TaxID=1796055 RepID=A0AAV9VFQ7_9PEZI